jgi:hypothetical protein
LHLAVPFTGAQCSRSNPGARFQFCAKSTGSVAHVNRLTPKTEREASRAHSLIPPRALPLERCA